MEITFFDVVRNSGTVGIVIWIVIFTMYPVGLFLGMISVVASSTRKKNITPLSFKMLIIAVVSYLFIGALGAINGSLESIGAVAADEVSAKASIIALSISNSMYILSFTLLGMVPFLFFIAVSVIILHFRQFPLTVKELMALEENK